MAVWLGLQVPQQVLVWQEQPLGLVLQGLRV
jgi:hypothetical protein